MNISLKQLETHTRKIKNATEQELSDIRHAYKELIGTEERLSSKKLLILAVFGALIIIFFQSGFLDIVGLIVLLYPFALFIYQESHAEGFFEGQYDLLKKEKNK